MNITVVVTTSDKVVNTERRATALNVIEYFGDAFPDLRLKIVLDHKEWDALKAHGEENRGAFRPVNETVYRGTRWPSHFREELAMVDLENSRLVYSCDAAVYLHDSTCQNRDSLTMTLAHELQHFIQYGCYQKVWAYNGVVTNLHKNTIAAWGLTWHDIPKEREARIVARRASEAILGTDATAAYIDSRIACGRIPRDISDWKAIREIDTSPNHKYDCEGETRHLFQRLQPIRAELENALTDLRGLPEFAKLNLDDAFVPE